MKCEKSLPMALLTCVLNAQSNSQCCVSEILGDQGPYIQDA
uniref:Uncharacterized protein n=1 Tax=Rhizophora mucronata TaxID=61149 RepID=A0A2P2KLC6_RHIMU